MAPRTVGATNANGGLSEERVYLGMEMLMLMACSGRRLEEERRLEDKSRAQI
jgi:hypothetical protein